MIHYVAPELGTNALGEYLESIGRGLVGRVRVIDYDTLLGSSEFAAGAYILSGIDQLDSVTQNRLGELCGQFAGAPQLRVLNSPRETLLRSDLLAALHREGFNIHRAVRATDSLRHLTFPVFIREEHGHEGNLSPLLLTPWQVDAELGVLMARGYRLRDLRVIEFLDTSDQAGFYRTYGAFVVGGEVVPQFLSYGRHWMLKSGGTEFSPAMLLEERRYVLENPHEQALRRIFDLTKTGYGRIDYSLRGGAIETWEINLNPTIGWSFQSARDGVPEELRNLREPTRWHFARRFQAALEAVDCPGDPVRFTPDSPSVVRQRLHLLPGAVERGSKHAILKRFLRPVKPLTFVLARLLLPLYFRIRRWWL